MANKIEFKNTIVNVGDTIRVHQNIKEDKKERSQVFEGIVIAIKGKAEGKSITVRRIATGNIGVERIWPINTPHITKVEVKRKGKVKRAKLYYLRKRIGKKATRVKKGITNKTQEKEEVKVEKKPINEKKTSEKKTDNKK
ncbi:50S ribosomal protein L19 [Candidatus Beckwithbacteria bacterium CG10_big_fil_rev_8_21_14_0_10_34_10]|uniref:50S ribosomal protein L19 n=1 Tax=Candidatus Beckwithbacteria bacterium CG10_big_fil_rev_8_21_14_0_10_34_10 TaxID=1974495 RepID=A0A2H0WAB9_9BACT|nr:MAG: 50S ribosomal protein L19 [Candidatus Beckwithbacteria bacterium CG10_big_fil_rev_8_21_14_0_10_34_10]